MRKGARIVTPLGLITTPSKVSFSFPLANDPAGLLLGMATSPNASRFLFPAGTSSLVSLAVDALALEAAVARVTPPIREVAVVGTRGLVRLEIREGRAVVFSFSLTEVDLVVLVTRRVWYKGSGPSIYQAKQATYRNVGGHLSEYVLSGKSNYEHHVYSTNRI